MRFWDSSAIIALLIQEAESDYCIKAFKTDVEMTVWTLTKIEVFSALCRRFRENALPENDFEKAKKRMSELFDMTFEVVSLTKVKDRSMRLLQTHSLRAADALQLASALVASQEDPSRLPFMSFDNRLIRAAKREGFVVNPA